MAFALEISMTGITLAKDTECTIAAATLPMTIYRPLHNPKLEKSECETSSAFEACAMEELAPLGMVRAILRLPKYATSYDKQKLNVSVGTLTDVITYDQHSTSMGLTVGS